MSQSDRRRHEPAAGVGRMSAGNGTLPGMRPASRRFLLAGVCLALAGLLLAGALLLAHGASPPPGTWPEVPAAAELAADKTIGINVDLGAHDADGREAALADMEAAGLSWLRQRFAWDAIEARRGQFDWARADEIVADVARHGLRLIAVLDGSPAWARAEGDATNPLAPPIEAWDYGAFVAAFGRRYGDRVDYYQVWEEPNIAPHWGAREIDPAAYGRLLREAALQLRTVDPGAVVLLAALAPNVEPGGANMSELQFLDRLYAAGAAPWFDVVPAQLYPFEQPAGAPPDPGRLNWKRAALLRRVMEDHGDQETAIWAVRFGWPSARMSDLAGAMAAARQDWPWLGPALWAAWSPADVHGEYAVVDAANRPGSGYEALARLAGQPVVAWPGVYPADHSSGRKEGNWRVTRGAADIGASGDRLTIPFWGTRFDLSVRRGDYRAFLFVTVDGRPANALPRDESGRSYVVLYDPLGEEDRVTLARGLSPGEHTVEIVAERGWGQWAISGWTVARELPGRRPVVAAVLGALALVPLAVLVGSCRPACRLARAVGSLLARYQHLDDRIALAVAATAVLLLLGSQGLVLSLLALAVVGLVLVLRPEAALPLIVLSLPFYQPSKPIAGKIFSVVEILTVLAFLGWVVNRALRAIAARLAAPALPRRTPPRRAWSVRAVVARLSPLDWAIVALVAWSAISMLWAAHSREAAREFRTVVLEAGAFYALLRITVTGRRQAWRLVDAWVLGATAAAAIGIGQWAFGQNVITADGVWRVRALYGSPNNLALYLDRVLPLVLAMAVLGGRTLWPWRRVAYAVATLVIAVALFLTYSRGAWLIGVPAGLLFLAAVRGRKTMAVSAGVLAVVLLGVLVLAGTGRLTSLLDSSQGTTFFRLQLWRSSLSMARDHPLLGVGLDNFLYAYRTRYVLPAAWEEFNLSHPHNLVLHFWLSLGLPGVGLLLWLLTAFFRQAWRTYRRLPAVGQDGLLMLGLMGGMAALIAHGMVDLAFFLVDLAFVFMLMAALVHGTFWTGGPAAFVATDEG